MYSLCLLPTANATRKLLAAEKNCHFDAMHKCHDEWKQTFTTIVQFNRILTAFEYPVPSKFILLWHSIHRVSESDHRYDWKQTGRSHISYRLKLELYWPDPVYKYVSCMSNVSLICWLFFKNLVSTQKIWNHVQTVWEPDKSLFWLAANISTLRRFEGRRDLYSS